MPTYSYKCKKCNKVFDAFHSMSCKDPQHCPDCNGVGQKLMSASSVIFKGSGFYSTDYRDSGYLEAKKRDNESAKSKDDKGKEKSGEKKEAKPSSESKSDTSTSTKSDTTVPSAAFL
ncbi:MAG: FmdB family zinc ribbon protein [Candidatus Rifleibacteriota bacterium]